MFYKKVDTKNRKEMIDFLLHHFRYYTMNSWNVSTSYANNVKIYNLDIPAEYRNKAYELLEIGETFDVFYDLFDEFRTQTGYNIGFNGRSSGYLVLYKANYNNKIGSFVTYPGHDIDQYEDFEDWSLKDLQDRVQLVTAFDQLCDECRDAFINILKQYNIVESTEYEPVRVKHLVEKE